MAKSIALQFETWAPVERLLVGVHDHFVGQQINAPLSRFRLNHSKHALSSQTIRIRV